METEHKFNREIADFLLTDLLPYEKGNHFTHRHLYNYLQKNKKAFNNIVSLVSTKENNKNFNTNWISAPLGFLISKKDNEFREISLINPLGLLQSIIFIELFEDDIINIIQNQNDFSVRKAERTNKLRYKNRENQTIYYSGSLIEKKQILMSLESSGTYFQHKYKTITKLLNSNEFNHCKEKYKYVLKLDIQNFFPNIYTHSYKWIIANKAYDSKALGAQNAVYSVIDKYLQNINGAKTNGIIVGPEISRLISDFLLVHLDQKLIELLNSEKITKNKDYEIFRFVDDYYIFTNEEQIQKVIESKLSNVLNDFQLKLNEAKAFRYKAIDFTSKWYYEISSLNDTISKIFEESSELKNLYEIKKEAEKVEAVEILNLIEIPMKHFKKRNSYKKVQCLHLKNKITNAIHFSNEPTLISSYLLSTILSKIENQDYLEKEFNMKIQDIVNLAFFLYSKKISYSSTQKLIRVLSLLLEKNTYEVKMSIERNISTFESFIFTEYPSDWIDLLLFFQSYDIDISSNLFERITEQLLKDENPVIIAALGIYVQDSKVPHDSVLRKINKLIKSKIDTLNWEQFFNDKNSWWVFIFLSYPKLNINIKRNLINKLNDKLNEYNNCIHSGRNKDFSDVLTKKMIVEFLLNNKFHFIEWDFSSLNYYREFYFYTKDRTVFNPDIIDQLNISR